MFSFLQGPQLKHQHQQKPVFQDGELKHRFTQLFDLLHWIWSYNWSRKFPLMRKKDQLCSGLCIQISFNRVLNFILKSTSFWIHIVSQLYVSMSKKPLALRTKRSEWSRYDRRPWGSSQLYAALDALTVVFTSRFWDSGVIGSRWEKLQKWRKLQRTNYSLKFHKLFQQNPDHAHAHFSNFQGMPLATLGSNRGLTPPDTSKSVKGFSVLIFSTVSSSFQSRLRRKRSNRRINQR